MWGADVAWPELIVSPGQMPSIGKKTTVGPLSPLMMAVQLGCHQVPI